MLLLTLSEVKRLVLMEAALPGLGLEKLYDADKYPRMYHLPLFEAPNGLAEALITGREKMFVRHFMRQQAYNTAALEDDVLDGYADRLAAPGALHAGIAYFRTHKIDAEHNRKNAKTKLPMPVLTVGGTASFGADLEGEIRPLAKHLRAVMIDELRPLPGRRATGAPPGRTSAVLPRRCVRAGWLHASTGSDLDAAVRLCSVLVDNIHARGNGRFWRPERLPFQHPIEPREQTSFGACRSSSICSKFCPEMCRSRPPRHCSTSRNSGFRMRVRCIEEATCRKARQITKRYAIRAGSIQP